MSTMLPKIPAGNTGALYGNNRLYTGREYDKESGLYYNRARYYDPTHGRFLSRDPIGYIDDVNPYRYVGNNPLLFVDRWGLAKALIAIGQESKAFGIFERHAINDIAYAEKLRLISLGIKEKNIDYYKMYTKADFQKVINATGYKFISIVTHGDENNIKIDKKNEEIINKNNVSEIQGVNSCISREIRLIGCHTGNGKSNIAQNLSSQIGENITAPNGYVTFNNNTTSYTLTARLPMPLYNFLGLEKLKFNSFNP